MPPEDTRKRVEQFHETLALALLDRKLELASLPVTFYYDADVVLRMIMGFELDRPAGQPPSQAENLVRALLACGFLGTVEMLRPHALEFADNLPRHNTQDVLRQKTKGYIRGSGIEPILEELRKIIHSNRDEESRLETFLAFLRDKGGDTFIAIEKVSGSWLQRLRRHYDSRLILFDDLGPEMDELLTEDGAIVHEITRILRPERPPRFTLSLFNDAAALAMIYRFIQAYESGKIKRAVRFYTETKSVWQAFRRSTRLRELLSYEAPSDKEKPAVGSFAVRDSRYFIMRAWFHGLNPSDKEASLDAVERFACRLSESLKLTGETFEKAVRNMDFDGRQLIELLNGFERLTLMDSIWVRGRIPTAVTDYFEEWTEIFTFAQGEGAGQKVFQKISDIRNEIESKIARIRDWTRDFDLVLRSAEVRRAQIRGQIDDPMRDLGLVRWGYNLSEEERVDLVSLVRPLLQGGDDDVSVQAGELATRIHQGRYDAVQCAVACAALWALGRFEEIVEIVNGLEHGIGEDVSPTLHVVRAAAAMKNGTLDHEQRREIVQRISKLKGGLSDDRRKGVLLGIGYVLYHAWKQEMRGARIHHPSLTDGSSPGEAQEWAAMSFEAGEDASFLLPTGSLAWSFAINHCAYVGMVTGVEPQKSNEYLRELIKLQSFPSWNSRFDDTLGVSYLLEAEVIIERQVQDEDSREYLEHLVKRAGEYFERAKATEIGDIDIDEHLARLDQVKSKFEALRSRIAGGSDGH
jgi:hypothetical protein